MLENSLQEKLLFRESSIREVIYMNNSSKIEFIITPDGQIKVDVVGVKGNGCLKTIDEIIGNIDGEIAASQTTSEYYEPAEVITNDRKITTTKRY
jgi:hypothetical protein